jgi:hypothetical protein
MMGEAEALVHTTRAFGLAGLLYTFAYHDSSQVLAPTEWLCYSQS